MCVNIRDVLLLHSITYVAFPRLLGQGMREGAGVGEQEDMKVI
jgi:hypothetical protein